MSITMCMPKRTAALLLACMCLPIFSPGTFAQLRDAGVAEARQIARLYSATFDRYPDPDGLNFWIYSWVEGKTFLDVAEAFYQSPEFTESYGPLTDRQFVDQLYFNVLGRSGDTGGVDFWETQLASGASRASVLLGFSQSPENTANTDLAFSGIELFSDLGGPFFNFRSGDPRDHDFHPSPVRVNTPLRFSAIAAGFSHNCAIAYDRGHATAGAITSTTSSGAPSPRETAGHSLAAGTPVLVAGGHKFKQLIAGRPAQLWPGAIRRSLVLGFWRQRATRGWPGQQQSGAGSGRGWPHIRDPRRQCRRRIHLRAYRDGRGLVLGQQSVRLPGYRHGRRRCLPSHASDDQRAVPLHRCRRRRCLWREYRRRCLLLGRQYAGATGCGVCGSGWRPCRQQLASGSAGRRKVHPGSHRWLARLRA